MKNRLIVARKIIAVEKFRSMETADRELTPSMRTVRDADTAEKFPAQDGTEEKPRGALLDISEIQRLPWNSWRISPYSDRRRE